MDSLSPKQQKRLNRGLKIIESGGSQKDLEIIDSIDELDEKIDTIKEELGISLKDGLSSISEELKKKLDEELVYDIDKEEIILDLLLQIPTPKDGLDGKDYVITAKDKLEIAKSITVPIVERVIEKTEVIHETPIVTENVVEKAVTDEPDVIIEKINTSVKFIDRERVEGMVDIQRMIRETNARLYTGVSETRVRELLALIPIGAGGVTNVTATSPLTSSGGTTPNISTSMATNKLIGRGSASTGVMEEITLGTNISLSGTTLNVPAGAGGVASITGTANQVIASASTGAVTLSTPQDIATTSSVRFGKVTVGTTPLPTASWKYAIVDDQSNYFTINTDSSFVTTFDAVTGSGTTQYYVFKIGGAEKFRIGNNGSLLSSSTNFTTSLPSLKSTFAGGATTYISPLASSGFVGTQSNHPFYINTNDTNVVGFTTGGLVNIIATGSASTPALTIANDPNTGIYGDGADTLLIATGGADRVKINSTGMSIGTATSSARLRVKSSGDFVTTPTISLEAGSNSNQQGYISVAAGGIIGIHSNNFLYFSTAGSYTERMIIYNDGNVGIGTVSNSPAVPQARLEVKATSGTTFRLSYDQSNYVNHIVDINGAITYNAVSGSGSLSFYIWQTGGVERMRSTNGGNLGIGTGATVSARLHTISTTEQYRNGYNSTNYMSVTTGSAGSTTFDLTGTSPVFVFNQNFGIGTGATVSARLQAISTTEQLRLGYDASNYFKTVVASTGITNFTLTGTSPYFLFNNNVGIGTANNFPATPQARLEVCVASGSKNQRWSIDQSNYLDLTLTDGLNAVYNIQTGGSGTSYTFNGGTTFTVNALAYTKAGSASSKQSAIGGKIKDFFTDAGNTTTTETDLYTYTTEANILNTNGQVIEGSFTGIFVASATATRELKLYFGGTVIYDSTALPVTASTDWVISYTIIRVSSTVVRCGITFTSTTALADPFCKYIEVTGLTLSSTNVLKITGQAGGVGASTNDIVAKLGAVYWHPQAV